MNKETITILAKRVEPAVQPEQPVIALPGANYYQFISDAALKQSMHLVGSPGSGKSRYLGRIFAWQQLLRGKPAIILDPTGGVTDNLFDKILRLPPEIQEPLWQRILYCSPGSKQYIVPTPLYYRLHKEESFFESANRLPSVFKVQDPDLSSAPILGLNPLLECATHAGKIAIATNHQLDFVVDLVEHPSKYKGLLREVWTEYPELRASVEYFRSLMDPSSSGLREKKTGSFKTKLLPFVADPARMATYAAKHNRLNWLKLIKRNKVVVLDYREQLDADHLQFDMHWHLKTLMDAIKHRGMAGRGHEFMLIIDEVTALLSHRTHTGHAFLAEMLEELVTRLARNYGVNVVIAHQSLFQMDERIQNILMGMGNQIIGQLSNPDDAVRVARQFMRYDPHKVKKTENVWATIHPPAIVSYFGGPAFPYPHVIDERTVEYTPDEQILHWVNKILDLDRFQFVMQLATGEGGKKGPVKKITIANLDKDQYPNEAVLAPLRVALCRRDGIPLATLLAEIQARTEAVAPEKTNKTTAKSKSSTMKATHDPSTQSTNPVSGSDSLSPSGDGESANAGGTAHSAGADFWEPAEEA